MEYSQAASSIRNVGVKWALITWMENAFGARDAMAALSTAVRRLRNLGLSKGFTKWHQHASQAMEKANRVQGLASEAAARIFNAKLSTAWYVLADLL